MIDLLTVDKGLFCFLYYKLSGSEKAGSTKASDFLEESERLIRLLDVFISFSLSCSSLSKSLLFWLSE